MVAYNFQPEFISPILLGTKVSTIRPDGKRRHARAGEEVQLYVGMRTPDCALLLRARCLRSLPIEIHADHVRADGQCKANPVYYEILARNEGFSSFGNLQAWFDRRYGLPAVGFTQIIWDFGAAQDVAALAEFAGRVDVRGPA